MIIGVDIDGVLADFNAHFIEYVIAVTGRDLFPARPFDIPCWNYPEHYGYTPAEVSKVWVSIKQSASFWSRVSPYDDAFSALDTLVDRFRDDVYFITARPGLLAKRQTEDWLRLVGYPKAAVLITSHKGLAARTLELDVYIDDKFENALEVAQTSTRSYLLTRPWNTAYALERTGITRVDSLGEFLTALDG